jgi:hypothetical protein
VRRRFVLEVLTIEATLKVYSTLDADLRVVATAVMLREGDVSNILDCIFRKI